MNLAFGAGIATESFHSECSKPIVIRPVIHNPVLPGFHPDPSFVRVGDDYYLATSTFEWFPGVNLHHSRDLMNWRLTGHALTRRSQLDLRGVPDSGGVWAPSLSHHDGRFWLVYTNVRGTGMGRPFKDLSIFLTTATDIQGPWSEPIRLNSIGFDPSLFHDDDGRKWLVNMMWDFRKGRFRFAGIVAQEYDAVAQVLVGPTFPIFERPGVLIEGPNLYKKDGWYYLMVAEGGTSWEHGISMARSRCVTGPYIPDPDGPILTSRGDLSLELQKAGHGELICTPAGEWYLAHLASRPLRGLRSDAEDRADWRCPLGRETCIQKVEWVDGWLRLTGGGASPKLTWPAPQGLVETAWAPQPACDHFDAHTLDASWSSLREPVEDSWLTLCERPGWLRLRGRDSMTSLFHQSLIAKRITRFRVKVETRLDFQPTHFTQMAGLICYYDTRQHYYLRVTHDETRGRVLGVVLHDNGTYDELTDSQVSISGWMDLYLRAEVDHSRLQFLASADGTEWVPVGPELDFSKLSDDYGSTMRFTGTFVGLCAQDVGGAGRWADFDYFVLCDSV